MFVMQEYHIWQLKNIIHWLDKHKLADADNE